MFKRQICIVLIASVLLSACPELLLAQTPSTDEYISEVTSRVALRDDLAQRREEAEYRKQQIDETIRKIADERPPSGVDAAQWRSEQDRKVQWLRQFQTKNDDTLSRYDSNLQSVDQKLDFDRRYVMQADDPALQQALGTMVGVAGTAFIPVAGRPTLSGLKASVTRSAMAHKLSGTNAALGNANTQAANLANSRASMTAPVKANWTQSTVNGKVVLTNSATGQTKTMGAAEVRSADGSQMVKNSQAFRKGDYFNSLYQTKANIDNSIAQLRHERGLAKNAKAQKALDSKIGELQAKKSQVESDLAQADADQVGKPKGSAMKNLAVSAAKWAAFSVALTVTMNAVDQLRQNDWDFKSIDWKMATAPLRTAEFWGGTAGSFAVSMALTAMIPGGTFVKALASIGGAAIGWQLGTGNLFDTDWTELGVTSLGATLGTMLGAFAGPVGMFLGGMAGHFLSSWLLGKVREWLSARAVTYGREDRAAYDYGNPYDPDGWDEQPIEQVHYDADDMKMLKSKLDETYMQIQRYSRLEKSDENDRALRHAWRQYEVYRKEMDRLQQSARFQDYDPRAQIGQQQGSESW